MTSRLRLIQLASLGLLLGVLGFEVFQGLSTRVQARPAIQLVVTAMAFGLTLASHKRRNMLNEAAGWIVLLNVALLYTFQRVPTIYDFAAGVGALSLLVATLYKPARVRAVKS